MSELKVGDKVEIIGHHWENGREVIGLQHIIGRNGIITGTGDQYYDVSIEGENSDWGILPSDLKLIKVEKSETETKKLEVKTQKTIRLKEEGVTVSFTTNTKKQKVSITTKNGTSSIRLDQIDGFVALIDKLKLAIELA